MREKMTQADAAASVLEVDGGRLHYTVVTARIIEEGFDVWRDGWPGLTPQNSVFRAITEDVRVNGIFSRFDYEDGIVWIRGRYPRVH